MPAYFDEGWFAHEPAWHNLGTVKDHRPTTWEEARAGVLEWEPETRPVFTTDDDGNTIPIRGYQAITRSDTGSLLTIQADTYAVIGNGEFGGLIEYAMGVDLPGMPKLQFDTLCVLKGGKLIVTTLYLDKPIHVPGDPSNLYPFINFWTRHDGLGGMKCGANTLRVVCANTQAMAESQMDRHGFTFNIRHTKNWAEKMEEARKGIVASLASVSTWEAMAADLATRSLPENGVEWFLRKWLPYSTDMTDQQRDNVDFKRRAFQRAYDSATCEAIAGTPWGVLQAAIEAADHYFPAHSTETRAARILVHGDNYKASALRLAQKL